jgi:hypothetical protein
LALRPRAIVIKDDPVARLAQAVRLGRIGEERGVVPVAALGVQNGEPGLSPRVEAARRDATEPSRSRLLAVFAVDVEQLRHRRIGNVRHGLQQWPATEPGGEGLLNAAHLLRSESGDLA